MITRHRIHELLEIAQQGDKASKTIDIFLIVLIVLNVIAVVIETLPSIAGQYSAAFLLFDYFSAGIFAIEYGFRVWSSVESANVNKAYSDSRLRINYIFSPMAIIDLLAFLPSLLQAIVDTDLRFFKSFAPAAHVQTDPLFSFNGNGAECST